MKNEIQTGNLQAFRAFPLFIVSGGGLFFF